ncbi:MAG: IS66 family transposase [Planctomycetes bacterium]|nr:IS66 family transposase [Planctomycetota bacterium]
MGASMVGAARVGCAGCQRRDRRIAELECDVQSLRAKLSEVECGQHRQAHPFRRDQNDEASAVGASDESERHDGGADKKKKPGRRKGHQADLRPTPTPDETDRVIDVPLKECPMCHVHLYDRGQVTQYQTDLPPIVPIVTRFNIETGYCPCCRQYWQGRHPEQTSDAIGAAGNTLGPVVLTMGAELKHRLGVSYAKMCDFLKTYCDFKACPAAFIRAEQRLADLARPTYDLLLDALRRAQVVHADETGWRIGRVNAWLWVFSSKETTIYAIRHSRGHDVPEEILGANFDGYLIVDGGKAYEILTYTKGQCNAHLLRRTKNLQDIVGEREQKIVTTLHTLIQEAIDVAQRRDELTPEGFARRAAEIDNRLEAWLVDVYTRFEDRSAKLQKLAKHVANHRDEWLLFLRDPAVPLTNNHAEHMLRPAVITRKIGGCNKNLLGALVHSVLSSLMVTCHHQGKRFLDLARKLWQSNQPQAIPIEPLSNVS